MSTLGEKENFKMILSLIYSSIKTKIDIFNKDRSYLNFSIIKNYIIFFMILVRNIEQSGLFIKTVFESGTNFFKSLISLIQQLDSNNQKQLLGILNNIFCIIKNIKQLKIIKCFRIISTRIYRFSSFILFFNFH